MCAQRCLSSHHSRTLSTKDTSVAAAAHMKEGLLSKEWFASLAHGFGLDSFKNCTSSAELSYYPGSQGCGPVSPREAWSFSPSSNSEYGT